MKRLVLTSLLAREAQAITCYFRLPLRGLERFIKVDPGHCYCDKSRAFYPSQTEYDPSLLTLRSSPPGASFHAVGAGSICAVLAL